MIKISAILCTHNPRENYLQRVLAGLRAQSLPLDQWEFLLIDNASQSALSGRFDLSWHPLGRHVREDELGLTPARLRGIRESTAEILVFVDDDTILAPDYLEQALKIGADWPFIGSWGGAIKPEFEIPLPLWVGDQVWRLTVIDVETEVWSNLRDGFNNMPAGAGMCFRRNVGQAYLKRCQSSRHGAITDRKGTSLSGYGDMDLNYSALDLGLGTGRSPRLQLTHLIPATRLTLDYFVRHAEGDATSLMLFRASRDLPITAPKPSTLIARLRWFLHRLLHRVPRERHEIAMAHQRGLIKGYQMISK
jgi:hypothetical protein